MFQAYVSGLGATFVTLLAFGPAVFQNKRWYLGMHSQDFLL